MFSKKKEAGLLIEHRFGDGSFAQSNGVRAVRFDAQAAVPGCRAAYPVMTIDLDYLLIERQFDQFAKQQAHEECEKRCSAEVVETYALDRDLWNQAHPTGRVGNEEGPFPEHQTKLDAQKLYKELVRKHYDKPGMSSEEVDEQEKQHYKRLGEYRFTHYDLEKEYRSYRAKGIGYRFRVPEDLGIKVFIDHVEKAYKELGLEVSEGKHWRGMTVWKSTRPEVGNTLSDAFHIRLDDPKQMVPLLRELEGALSNDLLSYRELVEVDETVDRTTAKFKADQQKLAARGDEGAQR